VHPSDKAARLLSGMAHSRPASARSQRDLARAGLWATGPVQLELPLTAEGLSEILRASGRLKLTPDFDVLTWLCERWLRPLGSDEPDFQNSTGWAFFTLRDLGQALYRREPNSRDRGALRASLRRLRSVQVDLIGYDAHTGELDSHKATNDNLLDRIVSELDDVRADARRVGALRGSTFKVQLPLWLRQQLIDGHFVRLHWDTLRAFDERQDLAKRLWVYLAAERWKHEGGGTEGTWIPVGDKLFTALGMNFERPRDARAALKRACLTVRRHDVRYVALDLTRLFGRWRLDASRLTAAELSASKSERERVRAQARASLALGA